MLEAYSGISKEAYKPQCIPCCRQVGLKVKKASYEQSLKNMIGFDMTIDKRLCSGEQRHFEITDSLINAIKECGIHIALQPIFEVKSGEIFSFEALARWTHPIMGPISPDEFIPIAEHLGHIHALGLEVLSQACQFLTDYDKLFETRPMININISVQQLTYPNVVEDILNIVKMYHLPPERIVLEVTESYPLDGGMKVNAVLEQLNRFGFKLSIDDFGAGMSAITSLFNLPLYQVKLDKKLVSESIVSQPCMDFLTYLCGYGRKEGVRIVAEGVEDEMTVSKLKEITIPYVQGYYMYRPQSPNWWLKAESI
ncbi:MULTISPECIES: EAL domain-containing protein [unclassified Salinivibrio]|uniref:EAL domain-containing protein n=1 Tax=unclassified Salinivibrio TaxID=2636825 RepID=UPI00128E757D|nr:MULTISPECIES: EAL domain-containing protein [unclassified Salinivibrio]MPS33186.1 EAL domain-containing protein [Salinivibrio sp. VYel7]MPX94571.1 EAL domain-containing protein [Salinivibrio sp. VYel9]MPX97392.1 EAL domain-containing protein [Salinivibrio sp. VYel6]MPY00858.1 EAL domain-containing protein [Salinivibrio sp. VYel4]MPY03870.1 EAL domain-containing protein [Salinivibrio sp. VYel5]